MQNANVLCSLLCQGHESGCADLGVGSRLMLPLPLKRSALEKLALLLRPTLCTGLALLVCNSVTVNGSFVVFITPVLTLGRCLSPHFFLCVRNEPYLLLLILVEFYLKENIVCLFVYFCDHYNHQFLSFK